MLIPFRHLTMLFVLSGGFQAQAQPVELWSCAQGVFESSGHLAADAAADSSLWNRTTGDIVTPRCDAKTQALERYSQMLDTQFWHQVTFTGTLPVEALKPPVLRKHWSVGAIRGLSHVHRIPRWPRLMPPPLSACALLERRDRPAQHRASAPGWLSSDFVMLSRQWYASGPVCSPEPPVTPVGLLLFSVTMATAPRPCVAGMLVLKSSSTPDTRRRALAQGAASAQSSGATL